MFKLITTSVALLMASASALEAGYHASLDVDVIEQAKDAYFEEIVKVINSIQLPDFTDKHGNYAKGNSFHVKEATKDVQMYTEVEKNAFVFDNKQVTAVFKTKHFKYHVAPLLNAKGHAEVDMLRIEIRVGESFSVTTMDDGTMIPHFESVDVKTTIDRNHIKIHMSGNLLTDIGSLFEIFFKGTVANQIEVQVRDALQNKLPAVLNKKFEQSAGTIPIINMSNWMLDYQTPEALEVNDLFLAIGLKGLLFDARIGEEENSFPIPAMPFKSDQHPEKFQNWFSSYTINGILHSLTEVYPCNFWLNSTNADVQSEKLNAPTTNITVGQLNVLLPGITEYYGADQQVDIFADFHDVTDFQVFGDSQEMKAVLTFDLQFWVHTVSGAIEYAAGLGLERVSVGIDALTPPQENMAIILQLTLNQFNVEKVNILSCAFGTLNPTKVKLEINNGFRAAKPLINRILAGKPIQLPTQVGNIFMLEALTLSYYDDYVYAGITPIFIGPPKSTVAKPAPTFATINTAEYNVEYIREELFETVNGEDNLTISFMPVMNEIVQF